MRNDSWKQQGRDELRGVRQKLPTERKKAAIGTRVAFQQSRAELLLCANLFCANLVIEPQDRRNGLGIADGTAQYHANRL
jgi:hypothetical protein